MNILEFSFSLFDNLLSDSKRFVRVTPLRKPRIIFFDKKEKAFFTIHSRSRSDSITANQIFVQEDYSITGLKRNEEIKKSYHDILKRGKRPLIIDCGCNIGVSSLYFSKIFPESSIFGLDPDQGNVNSATTLCSSRDNIRIVQAAIGSESGFSEIIDPSSDSNKFEIKENPEGSIPMVTIPSIIKDHPEHEVFIVKVDIEGFERELFSKNTDWVDQTYLMFVEPHDWMFPKQRTTEPFLHVISKRNRDLILSNDNVISIKN